MINKFKNYYWLFIILTIISFIALVFCMVMIYISKEDSYKLTIYSCWISIASGLLFSTIVSFYVQYINDLTARNNFLNRINGIRNHEIDNLSKELSMFLSLYHGVEVCMIKKYEINDSLVDGLLDINIIRTNMQILSIKNDKEKEKNECLIENYLLLSGPLRQQYIELISKLNKKRMDLEKINLDSNFDVFSKNEIDSLKLINLFATKYNDNFYVLIEALLNIVKVFKLEINYDDYIYLMVLFALMNDNSQPTENQ